MNRVNFLTAAVALVGCSASAEPVTKDGLVSASGEADFGAIEVKGYFDVLAYLAGPHRYESESGRMVAQLNSDISQEAADQVVAVVEVI
ncbi:hypothetical protein TW86_10550 [Halomonas sp. S2151]|uniref:hypothetical protein n=1 Tax=Halomonas sp. S2151 TaxID=579478 RepID=UPI0005FA0906|nr:hypothetical protein [Halomonas sp. S2151]KJZ14021.1 hypothetical protein TW86_10550 [Halomonas sp. S2151]